MDLDGIKQCIRYNCDVTDARYAGIYSVCGLVMRLRDLYKWERGLPPWQEDESAKVLEWIGTKETCWENLADADYRPVPVNDHLVDAFDTAAVNEILRPAGLFYGAGYAQSLKPTFFLAKIAGQRTVNGRTVWTLGREMARDLLTLPAFTQDGQVVLRTEAGRMFLWDQIAYMSNSGRRALDFALNASGIPDSRPESIQRHFDSLWKVQERLYVQHEIGELAETVFRRPVWQSMLADYPHSAVELFIRALKDILADTGEQGTLLHLIQQRNAAGLGLFMAFGSGIIRKLTQPLICAFDAFLDEPVWEGVAEASHAVRQSAKSQALQVMEIYREGRQRKDLEGARNAIEAIMRRSGLIRK